jgi:LPS export ABC transporter protein LptC
MTRQGAGSIGKTGPGCPVQARKLLAPLSAAGGIAFFLILVFLSACKNDIQVIRSLDVVDTLPEMSAKDIQIFYSEKGKVQIKLVSPTLITKEEEETELIFPDGFMVYFYDTLMNVTSTITADYGISYQKKKLMEARHNVVVVNTEKGETLNTEELFWDRNREVIYSDKFVRITSGEQVINGEGLYSKAPFDQMEVKRVNGVLEIKEEPGR